MKAQVRRRRDEFMAVTRDRSHDHLYELLWEVVFSVSPRMIEGWYRNCGYIGD